MMWALIICGIITLLALVGGAHLSNNLRNSRKPPVESTQTGNDTNRVSFWKGDFWKGLWKAVKWIVLILIIAAATYFVWRQWHTVVEYFYPPHVTVQKWQYRWKKTEDISGAQPEVRHNCFEVKFRRRSHDVLEFDLYGNKEYTGIKIATARLERQPVGSEWKWVGRYDNSIISNSGYMRFNEEPFDGSIRYKGVHSDNDSLTEWMNTVIEETH